jgi:hypothetical protein
MRCVQKSPTNAHKPSLNSLLPKHPHTHFGGSNHHPQGVAEIKMHRLTATTHMVTFTHVEYEWTSIAHFVQYVNLCKITIK